MRLRSVSVDVQYSNWANGHPSIGQECAIVDKDNYWNSLDCDTAQLLVCQS